MPTYTLPNGIFDGLISNLLSIQCILIEILSFANAKGKNGFNSFRVGTFSDGFKSDSAASVAVKMFQGDCARFMAV